MCYRVQNVSVWSRYRKNMAKQMLNTRNSTVTKSIFALFILISLFAVVFLAGCSLFRQKAFDKKLGNNREAAECAKAWQQRGTKEGVPQEWHVELTPAGGGELRGRALEGYRKKVKDVKVTVKLIGKAKTKWKDAIEQKKEMPNPYLSWPDGWLENTVKELVTEGKQNRESQYVYPRANVILTLEIDGKVGAIARYNAASKTTSLEVHY